MFVYHQRPDAMLGTTLHPLRDLSTLDAERYALERSKYEGHEARKRIPEQRVPKLWCARQEVLNFAPVHPHLIFRAWAELGVVLPPKTWFRIPVACLAGLPAVVFTPRPGEVGTDKPDAAVSWLEPLTYRELTELPPETLAWYRELSGRGQRGAWFAHVPHVLVKGPVEVAEAGVIDWSDPL